jgi:hypothetical protein
VMVGGQGADEFHVGLGDIVADFQQGIDTIFIV